MTQENQWLGGIGWATQAHQVCMLDAEGACHGEREFPHDSNGLAARRASLLGTTGAPAGAISVAIETPRWPAVESLMDHGFAVHAINPKQLDRFRDGAINSRKFQAYAEKALARTLRPGNIVIRNNLSSHKTKAVRAAIRAAGARQWFVLPYSPDLNPIEQAFSTIKHAMRMARKRDLEVCSRHLARILATFTPTECVNHLRNSGYISVQNRTSLA